MQLTNVNSVPYDVRLTHNGEWLEVSRLFDGKPRMKSAWEVNGQEADIVVVLCYLGIGCALTYTQTARALLAEINPTKE
jgi:hypothetical protein